MNAELKRVHSPDIQNLERYIPENPENFGFLLQAMIGPEGQDGEESFDIEVCTPKWLEEKYSLEDVIIGRHHLIIREYNYARLVGVIRKYLQQCSGEDWTQVGEKVSRLGLWEFEDYIE